MAASLSVAEAAAWRWPVVGDDALIRYVVLMMHAGSKPFAQIIDINFPGSYLLEVVSLKAFGYGPHGLRLYDGALCLVLCSCTTLLIGKGWRLRVAGATAGLFFALIHLRDGVVQAGQRDLALAAILLVALSVLVLHASETPTLGRILLFELLIGATLTIKPVLFPMALLPILNPMQRHKLRERPFANLAYAMVCFLLPLALAGAWLLSNGAMTAFWSTVRLISRSHAPLAHKGMLFLAVHSVAPVGVLAALGIAAAARTSRFGDRAKAIAFSVCVASFAFIVQGKGFPYQRYPFLALVLLVSFWAIDHGLRGGRVQRTCAVLALALTAFWFSPRFAGNVRSYDADAPMQTALSSDLSALRARPSEVQCLDTVGGCIATLASLGLTQSTGFLYDCYAYAGPEKERNAYRAAFLGALRSQRPKYIVLTSQYCLDLEDKLSRTERWPALDDLLTRNYSVERRWQPVGSIRWWNQPEVPPSYEIFVRRSR